MKTCFSIPVVVAICLALGSGQYVHAQYVEHESIEVQTRGPVHEAFAEPIVLDPQPGIVVSQSPPADIEEVPPDEKPDNSNAVWIPGYWAWDDDRSDFIWLSGIWRIPPADMSWVPGYWTQVEKGYQWTPGFWMPISTKEIIYLPSPPATLENGPSGHIPRPDFIWVSGQWQWVGDRYVWKPGYWLGAKPDRIWISAHYIWTPRGVIFVPGYWDYPLDSRGILFAPVYIRRSVHTRRTFAYTPTIVIDTEYLNVTMFTRTRYEHYYFGDYYAADYVKRGIVPWFDVVHRQRIYDPIFVYQQWRHGHNDPQWERNVRHVYEIRRNNEALRPARTFSAMQVQIRQMSERDRRVYVFVRPLAEMVKSKKTVIRFEHLNQEHRQRFVDQGKELRIYTVQRSKWETRVPGKTGEKISPPVQVTRPLVIKIPQQLINPLIKPRIQTNTPQVRPIVPNQAPRLPSGIQPSRQSGDKKNVIIPRADRPAGKAVILNRIEPTTRPQLTVRGDKIEVNKIGGNKSGPARIEKPARTGTTRPIGNRDGVLKGSLPRTTTLPATTQPVPVVKPIKIKKSIVK